MDKRIAVQYLNKIFGAREGYIAVAYKDRGQGWQESQFAWPSEKAKLIGWATIHSDANLFICPALRKDSHTRKKGDMVPSQWLWADVDWQTVPADKRADVQERIKELGTYVVYSGTGTNAHVYVDLGAPVDPREFTKLNTGLRDYLYGDNKQADNSLLRLPGTTNWKTPEGTPVKATTLGHDKPIAVSRLMRKRAFRDAKVPVDAEATEWQFIEIEGLSRRLSAKVNMPVDQAIGIYGNRHNAVWAVTKDLYKVGMTLDEIHSLMDRFPPAMSKAADENGYDVHGDVDRCLARIVQTQEEIKDIENAPDDMDEVSEEEHHQELINEGVQRELIRREVRRNADMLEAMAGHTEPPPDTSESLDDALNTPAAPVQYMIDGLASATATVVITGQYKSGKTHLLVASLLTSLADNEPFLGSRAVHVPDTGAVVGHWNLEMSRLDLVDKYMRPALFKNPHNVKMANWQGYRLNILTPLGRQAAVEWLKSRGVIAWTIDSWSALCRMCGVDPNDNKEVGDLLGAITEIKVEAGVQVVFLLAHTARSSQDADKPGTRGASALDEGVDTRWMFTVDKSDVRYLQAEGRGTQMSAISLEFDEETGRSVIGAVTRQGAAADGAVQLVVKILQSRKPNGMDQTSLTKAIREVQKMGVAKAKEYITEAIEGNWVRTVAEPRAGGGRAQLMHYLVGDEPPAEDRRRNATPREVNLAVANGNGRRNRAT